MDRIRDDRAWALWKGIDFADGVAPTTSVPMDPDFKAANFDTQARHSPQQAQKTASYFVCSRVMIEPLAKEL